MPKPGKFNFEKPVAVVNDEDDATLAAIREGVRDARAGRTVRAEKFRKLLRLWIAGSSSPKAG
jgi:predicted transcriptional regulator